MWATRGPSWAGIVAVIFLAAILGCSNSRTVVVAPVRAPLDSAVPPIQPPRNVLICSGGGVYGAFSTGVLSGWTRTGTRPTFDVATGVSTGSLVACAGFLGPRYDTIARDFYTQTRANDVFRVRSVLSWPFSGAL
ncbi:MAG: patatin-like phospholipase family protein, partial [Gemmataceae bacterium]